MGQLRLADTLRFLEAITAAKTSLEVQAALLDVAGRYGLESAFGGVVPPAGVGPAEVGEYVLMQHFPAAWARRYNARNYLFRDPNFHRVLQPAFERFTWADAYDNSPSRADAALIAGEASEFGLKEGIVIPVELLDKRKAVFSFGGARPDYSPGDIEALAFATSCAVGKLLLHGADRGVATALSTRELDCLAWAAEGKSDWEMAVILGVAPSTVQKHILAARTKLGAVTRGHAIAKAFRLNLFR